MLIDTFKRAVGAGYKEIVLTGTHIGQYHYDVSGGLKSASNQPGVVYRRGGLESLLENFLKISGDYRIRLSSLDPRDLTDSLMSIAGEDPRVCDHLHISVQSLSADVLARMGRPYADLDKLIGSLCQFKARYPHCGLGADFIVGHPGETDAMFEETARAVELVGFTYGHVFRFSMRAGTESPKMPGQIAGPVKKSRSSALRAVLEKGREKFLLQQSLQTACPCCIIVECENPVRGVSGNYIKVEAPGARAVKNSWLRVALTGETRGGYYIGREIL
jgi:threonylcarbamoyladenosine tRNA methylthiotransferase MtaB